METVRVYRSVSDADRFFGLELADGAVLLLVFFVVFSVNRAGLFGNACVLALVYVGLRALKHGKPAGHVLSLTRYALASPFRRGAGHEDAEAADSQETK